MMWFLANYYHDRTILFSIGSLLINAVIGISNLVLGASLLSAWFIANSLYYLALCATRVYALKQYFSIIPLVNPDQRNVEELRIYRHTGYFLCILGFIYFFTCLLMYHYGNAIVYRGYMAYLFSIVSFVKMGLAIYGTIIAKHRKNPIVSALKRINIVDAMVSIVVTTCSLLILTSVEDAIEQTTILGIISSLGFILIGIIMLREKVQIEHHHNESVLIGNLKRAYDESKGEPLGFIAICGIIRDCLIPKN